jgi:hypothetical protein
MNNTVLKLFKSLFGKVTNQTGFFAQGPLDEEEKSIGQILFVRSANADLSLIVLEKAINRFPNAKITLFSTWTLHSNKIINSKLFDELIFIPLEQNKSVHKAMKKEVLSKLKSKIHPLIIVIYSPEFVYYRMQLLPFFLRKEHLLIYNENIDSFYFNNYHRKVILNHFFSRLPITYILGDSVLGFLGSLFKKVFYLIMLPFRYSALFCSFIYIYLGAKLFPAKK